MKRSQKRWHFQKFLMHFQPFKRLKFQTFAVVAKRRNSEPTCRQLILWKKDIVAKRRNDGIGENSSTKRDSQNTKRSGSLPKSIPSDTFPLATESKMAPLPFSQAWNLGKDTRTNMAIWGSSHRRMDWSACTTITKEIAESWLELAEVAKRRETWLKLGENLSSNLNQTRTKVKRYPTWTRLRTWHKSAWFGSTVWPGPEKH